MANINLLPLSPFLLNSLAGDQPGSALWALAQGGKPGLDQWRRKNGRPGAVPPALLAPNTGALDMTTMAPTPWNASPPPALGNALGPPPPMQPQRLIGFPPPPGPNWNPVNQQTYSPEPPVPAPSQDVFGANTTNVNAGDFSLQQGEFTPPPTYPGIDGTQQGVGGDGMSQAPQSQAMPPQASMAPQQAPQFNQGDPRGWSYSEPQNQQQQQPFNSQAGMWGLLAAGLGILANNTGHYGQAGPAIGKGSLIGLQTGLGVQQQEIRNQMAQREGDQRQQQLDQMAEYQKAQMRNLDSEIGMRTEQQDKLKREAEAQMQLQQAYQSSLAGIDPSKIVETLKDPNFHFALGMRLNATGNVAAGALAMKQGHELAKENKPKFQAVRVTTGGDTETTKMLEENSGKWSEVPDSKPSNKSALVNVNNGDKEFWKKFGDDQAAAFSAEQAAAKDAVTGIKDIHEGRRLLDAGVITGAGANLKVTLGKALQAGGVNYSDDAVANTEAYVANAGRSVGKLIKQFGAGTGLSDADRDYAEKMAGGKIALNEGSIRKILDINERAYRNVIRSYRPKARAIQNHPNSQFMPYAVDVEEPPEYQAQPNASGGSPADFYKGKK